MSVRNERIKLLATFLSTAGLALIVTGAVAPFINQQTGGIANIVCLVTGIALHFARQWVLGRLERDD